MGSEIAFGVIGLLGALIGGGVTVLITRITHAEQRRAAADLRAQHVADDRRRVSIDFLEHAERFRDHARELTDRADRGEAAERLAEARLPYDDEWVQLKARNAAVQVSGPPELAVAARELVQALSVYAARVEEHVEALPATASSRTQLRSAFDGAIAARDGFVAHGQRLSA